VPEKGILVASSNGSVGIQAAIDVIRSGGSALDAVVAGIEPVEANPDDNSVGFAGLPNLIGEVELDASIMDGRGLRAGAVGALQHYKDAIALARVVMEDLPHSLIAGAGAERLAREVGMTEMTLLTRASDKLWRRRLRRRGIRDAAFGPNLREWARRVTRDPELPTPPHGTVNFIARDREGNLACGVSTSGWAWKYPGRLGDSPIIGAGNYADNRWGAAACTGRGEKAMRCCTAHSVVTFLRFGMDLPTALKTAMEDLRALDDPYKGQISIVALDRDGRHGAASSAAGKTYIVQDEEMAEHEELVRLHVPVNAETDDISSDES